MNKFILFVEGNKKLKYGYGEYIRGLIKMLISFPLCNKIIIVKTDCHSISKFTRRTIGKLTVIYLPRFGKFPITSEKNELQLAISRRIVSYIYPYVIESSKIFIWVNNVNFLNVCLDFKSISENIRIFYTHHSFSWKYFHRFEDNFFEDLWHNDRKRINAIACELTNNQLELAKLSDLTITVTKHAEHHFIRLDEFIPNLVTIYNFSNLIKFFPSKKQARSKYNLSKSDFILLYVGRLSDDKGIRELIESAKIISKTITNFKLLLVGGGINEEYIRSTKFFWDNIIFVGEVNKNELNYLYKVADVGIIPSFHEQCSLVSIEMRIAKLPIIVSNVDGLKEMFVNGVDCLMLMTDLDEFNRIIIPSGYIERLVIYLFENYKIRKYLGEASFKKGNALFRMDLIYSKYLEVIRSKILLFVGVSIVSW